MNDSCSFLSGTQKAFLNVSNLTQHVRKGLLFAENKTHIWELRRLGRLDMIPAFPKYQTLKLTKGTTPRGRNHFQQPAPMRADSTTPGQQRQCNVQR